jgi:hypothetical protein
LFSPLPASTCQTVRPEVPENAASPQLQPEQAGTDLKTLAEERLAESPAHLVRTLLLSTGAGELETIHAEEFAWKPVSVMTRPYIVTARASTGDSGAICAFEVADVKVVNREDVEDPTADSPRPGKPAAPRPTIRRGVGVSVEERPLETSIDQS